MHPADIQAALKKQDYSMADVGKALSVSRYMVCNVIHGRTKSRRIANAIAKLLNTSANELWPGKYPDSYQRDPSSVADRLAAALAA